MAAASPGIAVVTKLKATAAVTAVVSGRIFPQLNTQEPDSPQIVYTVLGAETPSTLAGANRALKRYTLRLDCFAETEVAAGALGKLVREALTPDGTPWTDSGDGVQGCFHQDTLTDFTEDGFRFQSETFDLWHTAT